MRFTRASALIPVWIVACVQCPPAHGQWRVGAEVGSERFWGASTDTAGGGPSLRPYRPTSFGIGVARQAGRWDAGLRFRYLSASLALEGTEGLVAVKGIFDVYGAAALLAYRVARIAANELTLEAGPLLEIWSVAGEESRTRLGLQVGASLKVPLGAGLLGSLTAGAAVMPSPFTESQLDAGFQRRALWRRRLAGGLEIRL
ncbi:MAG TPA: hypothetical protein VF252_02025 [Gemmatimonadales bacterium]